ncbi:MAG: hypothetical protein EOO24_02370 [Comamonadaceae bacterium]|nr:MAG: hypothetical protein EOO24_02370 [Comamonadaceae bacterium]
MIAPLSRWVASGVRHEVLLRALPALRHDMAAPVSVARMTALLLKRQLTASSIDAAACAQRVVVLEEQMTALIEAIRLLRGWEAGGTDAGVTRAALVIRCVSLLRPVFDLRGVTIEVDPSIAPPEDAPAAPAPAEPERAWPNVSALRYLLLASLCCLHDCGPDTGSIRISADGEDALQLIAHPRPADAAAPLAAMPSSQAQLLVDAAALQCLADDLGYEVGFSERGVRLRLAAA